MPGQGKGWSSSNQKPIAKKGQGLVKRGDDDDDDNESTITQPGSLPTAEDYRRANRLQAAIDRIRQEDEMAGRVMGCLEIDCQQILENEYRQLLSAEDNDFIWELARTEKVARLKSEQLRQMSSATSVSSGSTVTPTNVAQGVNHDVNFAETIANSFATGVIKSLKMPEQSGMPILPEEVERFAGSIKNKFANSAGVGDYKTHIDSEALSWIKDIVRHNEVRIKEMYKLSATQIKEPETLPIEEFRKVLIDCLNGTTSMTVDFKTIFVNE